MSDEQKPIEASDGRISFKVRAGAEKTFSITMSQDATVQDLKNLLAGNDYAKVPADQQRLIYSGRVMKNDDALPVYKIKSNNTVHLVKNAASNPAPAPSGSAAAAAIPTSMAAGTANNPLAALTGARYAGHITLPSASMFGADGGMGAPNFDADMSRLMSDPLIQQSMAAALDNPAFVDNIIQSHPTLRNIPNARAILQSPLMRSMITNPDMIRMASRMSQAMASQSGGGFPMPGMMGNNPSRNNNNESETNTDAGSNTNINTSNSNNPFNRILPFLMNPAGPLAGSGGAAPRSEQPNAAANPFLALFDPPNAGGGEGAGAGGGTSMGGLGASNTGNTPSPPNNGASNAFPDMSLVQALLSGSGAGDNNPLGALGNFPSSFSIPPPQDNSPPEERYAQQLSQLNEMGFVDFERNVAALRRSGGNVQGAIEHLLNDM